MSDTTTGDQIPAGQAEQAESANDAATEASGLDVMYTQGESSAEEGVGKGETAREVAAQHIARLLYAPVSTWSRYVFHENDPHPFGSSRQKQGRE
ncbi:MAG TPA: hypothetical protein VFU63_04905 [Ktedonobacterales bacterium]|nr:hypothetical protein [Ktedonobacterales bacterium]